MTSPVYPVFEGDGAANGPMRPTASAHMGGLEFVDNPRYPPTDRRRMSATDFMQVEMVAERVARMVPALTLEWTLIDGSPSAVTGVICVNDAISIASITVFQDAPGLYAVSWPAGSLPPKRLLPVAVPHGEAVCASRTQTANVVYLSFHDLAGNLVNTPFTLYIDGE